MTRSDRNVAAQALRNIKVIRDRIADEQAALAKQEAKYKAVTGEPAPTMYVTTYDPDLVAYGYPR